MSFPIFTQEDFNVFEVDGLEQRMSALIETIRPKLEKIGEELTLFLSTLLQEPVYAHVAKHARRTVHPPKDTWVAWATNKRGYKQHPHFQVGLWGTHVFVWFALIYESPLKVDFAEHALPRVEELMKTIPEDYVWSLDHTKPEVIKHQELTAETLEEMFVRVKQVKKAEILCGIQFDNNDPILANPEAFKNKITKCFETLYPLYQLAYK